MAASSMSRAPLVATMTGSTTTFLACQARSRAPMTAMSGAEETMPIFTASGGMSSNTASICWARKVGVASKMARTPVVFWAVRAVRALMA